MTLPDERTRAVLRTREFLRSLIDPRTTPRVPSGLREEARNLLKHYPGPLDMENPTKSFKTHEECDNKKETNAEDSTKNICSCSKGG